jgi:hypothetical protein
VAVAPPAAGKGSKAKEPVEPQISYHSVAYLDLAPLLYPGATHIYGAFSLHPYSRADVMAKVKGG